MKQSIHPYLLSSVLGFSVLCTGSLALLETNIATQGHGLTGGLYQRSVEASFDENIPFRDMSVHAWNALKLGLLGQPSTGALIAKSGRMFTAEELVAPVSDFDFETELLTAKHQLQLLGIQLVPVIVPDKARIYSDELPHARSMELTNRYADVLRIVRDSGLLTPNLDATLMAAKANSEVFMKTDTHWSPHGAQAGARAVAELLAQSDLERSDFVTVSKSNRLFQGDLLSFAETGPFRALVGPVFETIATFQTEAMTPADDLFGDVEVPVALVGTSYSEKPEFHFEGFLKQETGLDLINYAQSGKGPFQPMRDFLASDALTQSSPKIVIWEIPERYISLKDLS